MKAGDVLFFNGQVIHGSYPNNSGTGFRRALIAHYVVGEAEKVAGFYHPLLNFAGEEVNLSLSADGGPCGIFVDSEDERMIKMVDGRHLAGETSLRPATAPQPLGGSDKVCRAPTK